MVDQTPVNRMKGYFTDSPGRFKKTESGAGSRGLGSHAIELGELQLRLLAADVKAASRRLIWFTILAIVGGVALLAATPVALHALGLYFSNQFEWTESSSLALAAGLATAFGTLLLIVAVLVVRAGIAKFNRSASEFRQNVEMLKEMVSRPSDCLDGQRH